MTDLPSLAYSRPQTLAEARVAMRREGACIYAGGTDLLVALQHRPERLAWVRELVDIKDLVDAQGIHASREGLRIGALVTARELMVSAHVRRWAPALREAAAATSAPLLRARGTIGGNIVTPHPAGDVLTALLALDATVDVMGTRGAVRTITIARLLATASDPRRLLLAVHVPRAEESAFEKVAHRRVFARSMVAVAVAREGRKVRVAVGGVHERPVVFAVDRAIVERSDLAPALTRAARALRDLDRAQLQLVASLVRRAVARSG